MGTTRNSGRKSQIGRENRPIQLGCGNCRGWQVGNGRFSRRCVLSHHATTPEETANGRRVITVGFMTSTFPSTAVYYIRMCSFHPTGPFGCRICPNVSRSSQQHVEKVSGNYKHRLADNDRQWTRGRFAVLLLRLLNLLVIRVEDDIETQFPFFAIACLGAGSARCLLNEDLPFLWADLDVDEFGGLRLREALRDVRWWMSLRFFMLADFAVNVRERQGARFLRVDLRRRSITQAVSVSMYVFGGPGKSFSNSQTLKKPLHNPRRFGISRACTPVTRSSTSYLDPACDTHVNSEKTKSEPAERERQSLSISLTSNFFSPSRRCSAAVSSSTARVRASSASSSLSLEVILRQRGATQVRTFVSRT